MPRCGQQTLRIRRFHADDDFSKMLGAALACLSCVFPTRLGMDGPFERADARVPTRHSQN